jgi:quinoprotein glucose dehydrogenase
MWAASAPLDAARGIVYLPISGPAANYWGGDRPGNGLFGNSIVAVDALTGKYLWHFQTTHHDLWDTDMPNGGLLFNVKRNGKSEPVIAQVPKTALFYELDRVTGKPALPIDEVAVPKGDVPGEYYSPTQPVPRITPPLARTSFTYDDIVTPEDTTPEHAAACRAMWDKAGGYLNYGPFTPFFYHADGTPPRSTIQLPGGTGGVNWGGMAVDPNTGVVFANVQNTSLVGWVERKNTTKSYSFDANDTNQPYDRASVDGKGPFFSFSAPISGKFDDAGKAVGPMAPCYKPPWSTLTAVDANTGKVKWAVPLRTGIRRRHQREALPRVRCRDRQAGVGSQTQQQRQCQPDQLSGPQRQAIRGDQCGRHDCRLCGSLIGQTPVQKEGILGWENSVNWRRPRF